MKYEVFQKHKDLQREERGRSRYNYLFFDNFKA